MANRFSRYIQIAYSVGLVMLAATFFSANAQPVPEPSRERLLNGLTVLFSQRPGDPNVLLKLRVQSGAAFDLAGKGGTMALLGDALFPDPATREYVSEQLGGRLEVSTDYDGINVTISGKASELERLIEFLRNALVTTQLTSENFTKIRQARLDELSKTANSAPKIADQAIAARLFGAFPYGHPASGTIESVAKLGRADLMLARERFLNADNATLAVVGGVDKLRLLRALRQLLGPWQKGDRMVPATFRQADAPDARVLLINQRDAKTAEVRLAVRGPARFDRDAESANVLAQIVRERWQSAFPGLSSVAVRNEAYALSGIFVLGASVPSASAAKAISSAREVFRALAQTGPTAAEVEHARGVILGTAYAQGSSPEAIADYWLDVETLKPAPSGSRASSIGTLADVQRAAAKLFKDNPQATIVVGDANQLKASFGSSAETQGGKPEMKPASVPATLPKKP